MSNPKSIVVKRVKKVAGGHHGGAWKVAYADFVTAMMAFFLLMWLLNMTSEEKRARLSTYFKHFSIYDQGGTSFMDKSSEIFNEAGEASQKTVREMLTTTAYNMKVMEEELKAGLMKQLGDAKDQVIIDTVEGGVRIQMTDKDGSLMFERGVNRLTPKAREILRVISGNIKGLPNRIAIEGHTDALKYAGSDYSNWELSTERASSARRELEANGISSARIERVSGFADKDPLIAGDPSDARNRRISFILKPSLEPVALLEDKGDDKAGANPVPDEDKDEGAVMVNKFEENLSLIKTGMNAVKAGDEEKADRADSQGLNVPAKQETGPVVRNWGAVIKREEWSPVTFYSKKKKETTAVTSVIEKDKSVKETPKGPIVINELTNPVISRDDLFKK
ncbi:MAG: OmpA family protein [Nitrospirae bacterium]|nr:OmpA family protein [Nitrospirota bacterium]